MHRLALVLFLGVPLALFAGDDPPDEPAPPPPPIPEPVPPSEIPDEDELEPEVVIRREDDRIVEEYRRGGQLYMVRITPHRGRPYYLIDTTGDGDLDSRRDYMHPVQPAHWRIIEW